MIGLEAAEHDLALQRLDAEQLTAESLRQSVLFIDDEVVSEPRDAVMLHLFEVAERIRIRQRPVLSETLPVVASLHIVKAACIAAVVA